MGEEVTRALLTLFDALFFSTEDEVALDTLLLDRFGGNLERRQATSAYGPVVFARPTAGAGDVVIPAGLEVYASTAPELRFRLRADVLMTGTTPVTGIVDCQSTGPQGNLAVGMMNRITNSPDPALTVSNTERLVGGSAKQSNAEVRAAIQQYFQTLARGTSSALALGAKQVEGVAIAVVDEAHIGPDDGGYIDVYVGDLDGQSNSTMTAQVTETLRAWRAAGVLVWVHAVSRLSLGLEVELVLSEAQTLGSLTAAIQDALVAYGQTLQAGETVYVSQLERVVINVSPYDRGGIIQDATVRIVRSGQTYTTDQAVPGVSAARFDRSSLSVEVAA